MARSSGAARLRPSSVSLAFHLGSTFPLALIHSRFSFSFFLWWVWAANSSTVLGGVNQEYKAQGGLLRNSKQLVTQLFQRNYADRILIFFGVAVYLLVVLYIFKKRLFPSDPNAPTPVMPSSSFTGGPEGEL